MAVALCKDLPIAYVKGSLKELSKPLFPQDEELSYDDGYDGPDGPERNTGDSDHNPITLS